MALPEGVEYGQVKWQGITAVADGADEDGNPDAVPVTGKVTFVPSATVLLATADPTPVTVFAKPVECTVDSEGILRDSQGRDTVTLLATDAAGITPTGWTWGVNYALGGVARGAFSFALPAGTTVDLTTVAPVGASGGTQIVQGPAGEPGPEGPAGPGGPTTVLVDGQLVETFSVDSTPVTAETLGVFGMAIHGTNAAYPRPTTGLPVIWFGTVEPTALADGDVYVPVAAAN